MNDIEIVIIGLLLSASAYALYQVIMRRLDQRVITIIEFFKDEFKDEIIGGMYELASKTETTKDEDLIDYIAENWDKIWDKILHGTQENEG